VLWEEWGTCFAEPAIVSVQVELRRAETLGILTGTAAPAARNPSWQYMLARGSPGEREFFRAAARVALSHLSRQH
jgi:hypothetical protein